MTGRRRRWLLAAGTAAIIALGLLAWRMPEAMAWWWRLRAGRPAMTTTAVSLAPGLHWFDDYYAVAELGDGTYAIGEPYYGQCNFSYLFVGSERALLFDGGPGVRDIRPVLHSLTSLAVEALPSHLHFDHTGNFARLEHIALPDLPALRHQARDGRFEPGLYQFLGFVEGFERPRFAVERWIEPGATIDLGGRQLTMLSLPGHTPESVALLDRRSNHLYAGDFIYPTEIYAFLPGADLDTYAASARRLLGDIDAHTQVYGAHGCEHLPSVDLPRLGRGDVADLAKALEAAASGTGYWPLGFPREFPVNERMTLLAKYPWMSR